MLHVPFHVSLQIVCFIYLLGASNLSIVTRCIMSNTKLNPLIFLWKEVALPSSTCSWPPDSYLHATFLAAADCISFRSRPGPRDRGYPCNTSQVTGWWDEIFPSSADFSLVMILHDGTGGDSAPQANCGETVVLLCGRASDIREEPGGETQKAHAPFTCCISHMCCGLGPWPCSSTTC
jgi:hypothetical protein